MSGLRLAVLAGVVVALGVLRLLLGRVPDGEGGVSLLIAWPEAGVLGLRMTALWASVIVGGSLGLSGLAFQVLLRNPLASPWVLGVSAGAGLGIMIGQWSLAMGGVLGVVGGVLLAGNGIVGAATGTLVSLVLVLWIGRRLGGFDPVSLVLAGIIVSATFAALIMLLQHLVPHGVRDDLITWMMGRIPWSIDWRVLAGIGGVLGVAGALGVRFARALDVMCLGELEARSIGVRVDGVRWGLLVGGGVLAAGAVVIAGPIAFVGLVAPHAARRMVGAQHRSLVVGAILAGAAMLLLAENVRQWIDLGGGRLPIGVLTALVGGPAFLVLLLRGGRGR